MAFVCPQGTTKTFRSKNISRGRRQQLGGCAKKGRFIENGVVEVKTFTRSGRPVSSHTRMPPTRFKG